MQQVGAIDLINPEPTKQDYQWINFRIRNIKAILETQSWTKPKRRKSMLNTSTSRHNGTTPDKTVLDNLASDSTGYIASTLNAALKNKLVVLEPISVVYGAQKVVK